MKKNYFFLLPALALLTCAGLQAQVTIGGNTDPVAGALLDLNSDVKGGLLLSNIAIEDLGKIPANELLGISSGQDENPNLRGMIVYNTGTDNVPAGIYVWNGYYWTPDGNYTLIVTTPIRDFTVSGTEQADLEVTADGYPSFTYTWYKNTAASTTDGTPVDNSPNAATYQTPTGLAGGTHYYYCTVKADDSDVVAVSDLFTVTVTAPPAKPGPIKGFQTVCTNTSQTYYVESVDGAEEYAWTLPNGWNGNNSTSNSITVTAPNSGGATVDISVKARNSYGDSDSQTLTIYRGTVSRPNKGAVWMANDNNYLNVASGNINNYFTINTDSLLCFAHQSSELTNRNWESAVQTCNSVGNEWRLPNIAELKNASEGYKVHKLSNTYWSITQSSDTNAWICNIATNDVTTAMKPEKGNLHRVRCVKTIDTF
jgi:hypothetical protein